MSAGGLAMDINFDQFHQNLAGKFDAGEKEPSVAGSRGGSIRSGVKNSRSSSRPGTGGSNVTASSCLRAELEKEKKARADVEAELAKLKGMLDSKSQLASGLLPKGFMVPEPNPP